MRDIFKKKQENIDWILCPTKAMLDDGTTFYEVYPKDFQSYMTIPNMQAIWFWSKSRKHGKPPDWRNMTMQQLAVIELFDALWGLREEELEKAEGLKKGR